ncbi:MAG: hypothetical protein A3D13_10365 [Planctomycetes bacterium RIFCSPHIGHO2_02_FULL_40_12]|nr:MAG: hypothetical protein A3D13_10365 [Planctomycetes bacterium RIFCSPHIGHO2_02_FULL_40_12]
MTILSILPIVRKHILKWGRKNAFYKILPARMTRSGGPARIDTRPNGVDGRAGGLANIPGVKALAFYFLTC